MRIRRRRLRALDCCGSDTVFLDPGQIVASARAAPATLPAITLLIEIKARTFLSLDCLFSMRPVSRSAGEDRWL
jgi:hypothetical protein